MPPVSQKLHIPASQAGKVEAFYTEHFDELWVLKVADPPAEYRFSSVRAIVCGDNVHGKGQHADDDRPATPAPYNNIS